MCFFSPPESQHFCQHQCEIRQDLWFRGLRKVRDQGLGEECGWEGDFPIPLETPVWSSDRAGVTLAPGTFGARKLPTPVLSGQGDLTIPQG